MKEIALENDVLRVKICPSMGGKITSFYLKEKDFELAAQSSAIRDEARRQLQAKKEIGGFGAYAFGMDDAFPNIDKETVEWKGRELFYPDHGEIWKADFHVIEKTAEHVVLCWDSTAFSYRYEKEMRLEDNTLVIQYHILNNSEEELPCIWTWHGLVAYEQDMVILLPESVTHYRNVLEGCILGAEGTVYPVQNEIYDFAKMPNPNICSMVKYYGEEPVQTGHCGIYYPSKNVSYCLEYDAGKLPYLGVWITAGGLDGDYNCALEPTNGFYDSIGKAGKHQKLPVLGKGEALDFTFGITLREGKIHK